VTGNRFIMVCLLSVNNMEKNIEFCSEQTQQIKQDQRIYAIILTTDLNKEDENIKEIIERHLRKKKPEIRGIWFNCSRDMLQLFLLQLFPERN